MSVLSCLNGNALDQEPLSDIKSIVDKVQKHVCGHASFSNVKIMLEPNGVWNDFLERYLSQTFEKRHSMQGDITSSAEPESFDIFTLSKSE